MNKHAGDDRSFGDQLRAARFAAITARIVHADTPEARQRAIHDAHRFVDSLPEEERDHRRAEVDELARRFGT